MASTYAFSVSQQWKESKGRLFCVDALFVSIFIQQYIFVHRIISIIYVLKDFNVFMSRLCLCNLWTIVCDKNKWR